MGKPKSLLNDPTADSKYTARELAGELCNAVLTGEKTMAEARRIVSEWRQSLSLEELEAFKLDMPSLKQMLHAVGEGIATELYIHSVT